MSLSILVVDDDRTIRETLVEFFEASGYTARGAETATEARRLAAEHAPDLALVDLHLPDADGLTLLETLRADDPEIGVIVLTGHADVATAVRAMREGALDLLEKPVRLDVLDVAVRRAAEFGRLHREVAHLRAHGVQDAPDESQLGIERLVTLAARHADAPVLILGETGTGKGYVARRIHDRSVRAPLPFVEINGASLSPTFFESELFGHERGAFTDARQTKRGLLEVAGRGTLFLDEIGEVSADVQPKLLTAIEDRTFRRLGGTVPLRSEARIIAATNRPLAAAVEAGRFRADLFYRLQVLTIMLPPLRERRDEILALATTLAPRGTRLSDAAERALLAYGWPGNVRELRNALWRASILAEGAAVGPEHLGLASGVTSAPAAPPSSGASSTLPLTLAEAERRAIDDALAATGGNRTRAARMLGIARSTLIEKLARAT